MNKFEEKVLEVEIKNLNICNTIGIIICELQYARYCPHASYNTPHLLFSNISNSFRMCSPQQIRSGRVQYTIIYNATAAVELFASAAVLAQKSTPKKMFGELRAASRTKFFVGHLDLSHREGCFFPGNTFMS